MAWGWGWGQPNRYGYYGLNCKMRPAGAGTTHSNRREARKALPWEYLEEEDPEENLENHLKALEKAQQRAKQRLEELKKKKEEEEYTYTYSSSSSQESKRSRSRAASKAPPKQAALEKVAPASSSQATLEKVAPEGEVRRTRKAKDGSKEKPLKVKEDEDAQSLEKDTKEGKSLKKDPAKSQQDVQRGKSLEKDTGTSSKIASKSLEKDTGTSSKDASKSLGKDTGTSSKDASKPLEKGSSPGVVLKPAPKMPVLVVDWHHTLEVNDQIPAANMAALEKVAMIADVHILSYVASWTREEAVKKDFAAMIPLHIQRRLVGMHTCWQRTGKGGKLSWCEWLGADAIMDDDNEIIQECKKSLDCYAICGPKGKHHNLPAHMVWKSFAEAVEVFLEDWDL